MDNMWYSRIFVDGYLCQLNVDDCMVDSCLNNGTCIDEVKNFKCECHEAYEGEFTDSLIYNFA